MKICIVTVHDSINSGSFWQAFALGRMLEKLGHEAVYLRRSAYDHTGNFKKNMLKTLAGSFIFQGPKEGFRHLCTLKKFISEQRRMKQTGMSAAEISGIDCFVLGSDTIWNFESGHFRRNRDVFMGKPFLDKNKKVFPYAASAANTPVELFREMQDVEQVIRRWQAVGVRDAHTRDILSELTEREISIVCDPTLLLEKKDYVSMARDISSDQYIFLYLFSPLQKKHADELTAFAREKGLKIIHCIIGNTGVNCDESVANLPQNFLSYMLHAQYIVTDTFHGAIFSTNLEKRFAAIDRGKMKVNQFLAQMQITDRLVGKDASLAEVLASSIDYDRVRETVDTHRKASIDYLKNALGE